jgi:hypothetical protein
MAASGTQKKRANFMPQARAPADLCGSPFGLLRAYVALNRGTKLDELRQLIFVLMGKRSGFGSLPWADAVFMVAAGDRSKEDLTRASTRSGKSKEE